MRARRKKPSLPSLQSSTEQPLAEQMPEWLDQVRVSVEEKTPLMQVLMMRSINAVMRFDKLSQDSVVNATTAETDLGVLMRALASGELLDDLRSFEPLAPAFLRGIQARNQLLNENGETLTAEQVADVLGISR